MPESKKHWNLVKITKEWILNHYSPIIIYADIDDGEFGFKRPPAIGGYIPDIFAYKVSNELLIIGEAEKSLRGKHAELQIIALLKYFEVASYKDKIFILSILYEHGDDAKFLLRILHKNLSLDKIKLMIFDECDMWKYEGDGKWVLIY